MNLDSLTVEQWLDQMPTTSLKYRLLEIHARKGDLGKLLRDVYPKMAKSLATAQV